MAGMVNIAVWLINLDSEISNIEFHASIVDRSERIRSAKFSRSRDANHFIVRRSCLRLVLSYYIDISPEAIRFDYNQYGKPFIANERFFFSTSCSGQYAVIAIMKDYECGIDIESVKYHFKEGEHEFFLSPFEREQLQHIAIEDRNLFLLHKWVQKEAVLKTLGTGLSTSPTDYTITHGSMAVPVMKNSKYKRMFLKSTCINGINARYYISIASYKPFNHVYVNRFVSEQGETIPSAIQEIDSVIQKDYP